VSIIFSPLDGSMNKYIILINMNNIIPESPTNHQFNESDDEEEEEQYSPTPPKKNLKSQIIEVQKEPKRAKP